jgi:glycosyltransferase involved in cell wall biosynthesis
MKGMSDKTGSTAYRVMTDPNPNSVSRGRIRILAVMEGTTVVTGVSKNLLQFCRVARTLEACPLIDLTIATFERPQQRLSGSVNSIEPFVEAARQSGVQVHRIPEEFRFDPRILGHIRRLTKRLKPDLIQTHAQKSHFLVRLSGLYKTVPWIAFHHGYTETVWHSPIQNQMERYSFPAAARIVTVSNDFKRRLLRRGMPEERITVLYNAVQTPAGNIPIDPDVLCLNKQAVGISPKEKVVVAVGRLSREKGQIDLVSTLHHLHRVRPDVSVRVVLVGEGPDRRKILEAADSLGLAKWITLVGHQHNVAPYYQAADVVAIPSYSEGSPNVLLEAMAWGVPVVATSVGGIPEMVTHGETALLVPPGKTELMASAIDLLLSNANLAANLAREARATAEKSYSPEHRARTLVQIYADECRAAMQKASPNRIC